MGELRLTLRMEEEVNISIITASFITTLFVIKYSSQSSHLIAHLNLFQGTAAGFSLAPTDELLSVKSLQMKLSTSDNVMITYEIFKTGSSKLFNVSWAECPCTGLQVVFEMNKD